MTSPNFPSNYPNNAECTWKIRIGFHNDDDHVVLSFKTMDIEWSPDCFADSLEIHDGSDSLAPSLGRYCGIDIPGNKNSKI